MIKKYENNNRKRINYKSLVVSFDIDGTLLNDNKQVSNRNLKMLEKLKQLNILRVAATGRNCYSVLKVLGNDFPVDYVVFSSGAGILDWRTKKVIHSSHITKQDIVNILNLIKPFELNFTIHMPIPDNHHILLFNKHSNPNDLEDYTAFYKDFTKPFKFNNIPDKATQVIVLLNSHMHLFEQFKKELIPLKTILTTSPVNNSSMWMEVFNANVSKSNGVKWIINKLKIIAPTVLAIGNDYNDLDLLEFADKSFVVSNAPDELKNRFNVTASNNEDGFSEVINTIILLH